MGREDLRLLPNAVVSLQDEAARQGKIISQLVVPPIVIEQITADAYQVLIPPSIESRLVCGAKTEMPFADSFNNDA